MEDPMIRRTSLVPIKKALRNPSFVIVKNPISMSGVPFVINIFITKVNIIIRKIGFNPFKIKFSGTLEIPIINASVTRTIT